jgi:hypothetical protein
MWVGGSFEGNKENVFYRKDGFRGDRKSVMRSERRNLEAKKRIDDVRQRTFGRNHQNFPPQTAGNLYR